MDAKTYRGIFVIVTTPFTEDFRLDESGLERTMEFCLAAGVHGVVANALASEGGYLSEAERKRAAEIVVGAAKGKVPAIVAVSAAHYLIAADYARHAETIGADAVMAMPPTLHPSTVADVKAHYRGVAAATSLPLVVQNVIGTSATTMGAPLIVELLDEIAGTRLEGVMGGRGGKTLMEEVRHGVSGTMPACEIADVHVALWNAMEAKDDDLARRIFRHLLPLIDMEGSYGMPLMKEVLKMRGVISSAAVRQSGFRPLDKNAIEEAAAILDDLKPWMVERYRPSPN